MKSIFLTEGETHVRAALRFMIDYDSDLHLVGEAGDAESMLAQVCMSPPDVILLDWSLPGIHHRRVTRVLRKHCSASRIIATSVQPENQKCAFELGLDGFLLKQVPTTEFMSELKRTLHQLDRPRHRIQNG